MSNDIRSTLIISRQEAVNGTVRTISLPNGQQIPISVPAGAFEGQVLQFPLPGQTELLTLTIHVSDGLGNPPSGDGAFAANASSTPIPFETRTVPSGPHAAGYALEVPPPPSGASWQQAQMSGTNVPPPPPQSSETNWQQSQTSGQNWQQAQASGANIPPPPPQVSGPNWQQQYPVAPSPDPQSGPNAYATTPQVGQPYYPPAPVRKGGIGTRAIVLIVLAVVIIVGASALIFVNYNAQQTANINANKTATAQTATGVVNATSTSQVNGTQTAQVEATTASIQATNTVKQANPNPMVVMGFWQSMIGWMGRVEIPGQAIRSARLLMVRIMSEVPESGIFTFVP
ncbi:hypothetical protein KSX_83810 [Ktedonospora formicarum]|uniref:Uncharacterized protein n=2 Tax=Ktedonospora formicarum TaxID=2778364 RepID=A0A8J3MXY6_9CHLR|nr:hypothetical protein KSX_83810 [Ktedonospora formicarum]